jgi:two-component system invasion response regulator UvrY
MSNSKKTALPSCSSVNVFLADDHRLLVEGFCSSLDGHGITVVGTSYTLKEVVEQYFKLQPDVLIIDIRFGDREERSGLDVCEEILARDPKARIIVFSQFDDVYIIEKSYKLGVLAFIPKDETPNVIQDVIMRVAQGQEVMLDHVAHQLARSNIQDTNPNRVLNDRELDIFRLTADGLSIEGIATKLEIHKRLVYSTLKAVKKKLKINNDVELVKIAIRHGITGS